MSIYSILFLFSGCAAPYVPNEDLWYSSSTHSDVIDSGFAQDTADSGGSLSNTGQTCDDDGQFPVPYWPTSLPETQGFDPGLLQAAADYASENDSNCLVVVRHGQIVGEWYWQETEPDTLVKNWSVAKSYTSAVVGVAVDHGEISSVDAHASDWIPEWQGTDHEGITVSHLLAMSSGLRFDMIADNVTMPLASDMTSLALASPVENPPGALWEYNNHSVQALEPILRNATGMAADEYAKLQLFDPMGMTVDWKLDDMSQPAMYMNVRTTCRDNARFGYLYLQRGCWDGERLLSEEWIDDSIRSSTGMNRGYGRYWWLSGENPTLDSVTFEPKKNGLHPYAPVDAFCAAGLGSQMIEVIPSLDMVVVRLGTAPHDDLENWLDPVQLFDDLTHDGEQLVHNGVLERVLLALVEP